MQNFSPFWFQALNEPGVPAYYHGEERMCFVENLPHGIPPFWPQKLPIPNATFKDYYNILNGPYPGSRVGRIKSWIGWVWLRFNLKRWTSDCLKWIQPVVLVLVQEEES